jgi:hypothetical protein
MSMRFWFYVKQGGLTVAKGDCPTQAEAEREANHYAMMYSQDGPVTIKYRKVFNRIK